MPRKKTTETIVKSSGLRISQRNLTKLKIAQTVRSLDQWALDEILILAETFRTSGRIISLISSRRRKNL